MNVSSIKPMFCQHHFSLTCVTNPLERLLGRPHLTLLTLLLGNNYNFGHPRFHSLKFFSPWIVFVRAQPCMHQVSTKLLKHLKDLKVSVCLSQDDMYLY